MKLRPILAVLAVILALLGPQGSALGQTIKGAPLNGSAVRLLPPLPQLPPQGLSSLPALPMSAAGPALSAEDLSKWVSVSLLADPQSAGMFQDSEIAAQSVRDFLQDKPGLASRLAEIRRDFIAGRLGDAGRALDQVYEKIPALAARDAGTPAVAGRFGASSFSQLAPARPAWTKGVFLPQTNDAPLPEDGLGVTVHRLSNGMTVYLSPNRQEPRVSYEIAVRAGSRHDPLEATGMAHYLEHMQFKGTARLGTIDYAREKPHLDRIESLYDRLFQAHDPEKRKQLYAEIDKESQAAARYASPNEFDKLYSASGFTQVNAHTNYEETVYEGSFPSNKAEVWSLVEADRLTDPVYRIFLPELEAVYEEFNKSRDNPDDAFFEAAFRTLFKGHPYGRDIIGFGEHLKNPSISRMRKFFADYYHPNNMAIILSGDFDRQEMISRLEASFGHLKPAQIPPAPEGAITAPRGVERAEIRFQAEEAVQVGWILPGNNHPDQDALRVAEKLINNLVNLRLNKAQKVKSAAIHLQALNEAGAWLWIAEPKEGQTPEQAEAILMEEAAKLKAGDFTEEDLTTVLTQLEVERKELLEKNGERVGLIRESFIAAQEWKTAAGALERMKRLTKADILRVADLYLGEDRVVIYRRKGTSKPEKVSKPAFTPVPIDTAKQSPYFKELAAIPAEPLAPRFLRPGRDYKTLNRKWGRLYWANNPVNDLFNLTFQFDRGNGHEKKLDLALSLLEVSGAGGMDVEEFQQALDRLGSKMSVHCGERECEVKLAGLEKNLEETIRLAQLRFSRPNIAAGAFAEMIEVERGARADRKVDSKEINLALEEFAMRGKESEVLQELTPAELDALTMKDLKGVLRSVFTYRRSVLYSGGKKAKEVAQLLSSIGSSRRYKKAPALAPLRLLSPSRPRVVFVHQQGMKQALIGAYAADGDYDAASRLDYRLYDNVMGGGMGGIYFQEVRESRALAYSARGEYQTADRAGDDNNLAASAGTQADKAAQTARLISDLMRRPPITPERYAVALRQTEESYRSETPQFSEIPDKVRRWERLGFSGDPRAADFRELSSYRPERLEKFTARFKDKALTIFVLGDRERIDMEGLKKLGDFEERAVDEIFPY